jgi:C1A family cysteine protease
MNKKILVTLILFIFLSSSIANVVGTKIHILDDSSENLLSYNSEQIQDITDNQILTLNNQLKDDGYGFELARTSVTNRDVKQLCGLNPSEEEDLLIDNSEKISSSDLPDSFDLRNQYPWLRLSVRDQGSCGSCWAFCIMGALEGSMMKFDNELSPDLSEQWLVSCNKDGWGCDGGWFSATKYLHKKLDKCGKIGAPYEEDFKYTSGESGNNGGCKENVARHYMIDGVVDCSGSISKIKQAIYNYGPIFCGVSVHSLLWSLYSIGVYDYDHQSGVNHGVVLVGWKDDPNVKNGGYWILKNSWGQFWGLDGYMKIAYKVSNVGDYARYLKIDWSNAQDKKAGNEYYAKDDGWKKYKTNQMECDKRLSIIGEDCIYYKFEGIPRNFIQGGSVKVGVNFFADTETINQGPDLEVPSNPDNPDSDANWVKIKKSMGVIGEYRNKWYEVDEKYIDDSGNLYLRILCAAQGRARIKEIGLRYKDNFKPAELKISAVDGTNFGEIQPGTCVEKEFKLENIGDGTATGSVYVDPLDVGFKIKSIRGEREYFELSGRQSKIITVEFCPDHIGLRKTTLCIDAVECGDLTMNLKGGKNHNPEKPKITGDHIIGVGKQLSIEIQADDEDLDKIFYKIWWNDKEGGHELHGPYDSGEKVTLTHTYESAMSTEIEVCTQDIHEGKSALSFHKLLVTKSREKDILLTDFLENFSFLLHFFKSYFLNI